jgi:hypothetical protein
MKMKKIFCLTLGAMFLALCSPAEAQQAKKVPRIGFLAPFSASSDSTRTDAFLQGYAIWAMLKEKTLRLSTDTQKES